MNLQELMSLEDRAFVEAAYLRLLRRAADPSGLAFYVSEIEKGVPKQHVLQALATSPEGRAVGAELDGGSHTATTAEERNSSVGLATVHDQETLRSAMQDSAKRSFFVECAVSSGRHLYLLGWINDTGSPLTRVKVETPDGKRRSFALDGSSKAKCLRTARPDVHRNLNLAAHATMRLGFVTVLPVELADGAKAMVSFEGHEQSAQRVTVESGEAPEGLSGLLIHSGYVLRELAIGVQDAGVVKWIDRAHTARRAASQNLLGIESALALGGRSLLVIGWLAVAPEQVTSLRVVLGTNSIDAMSALVRIQRPDLFQRFPQLAPLPLGFFILLDHSEAAGCAEITVEVSTERGFQCLEVRSEIAGWPEVLPKLKEFPALCGPLLQACDASLTLASLPGYDDDISWLKREATASMSAKLPRSINNAFSTVAAVDRVVSFAGGGVLIVGWHHEPQARLVSMKLLCEDGSSIEVFDKLFALPRGDVYEAMVAQYPSVRQDSGFVLFAATPPSAAEPCALGFGLDNGCVEWLQVHISETVRTGDQLLRALSSSLGDVSKLDSTIFAFFEAGFGATIERLGTPPQVDPRARVERQFGDAPVRPDVSVIVPLYGRCDFLRYQLAHFADDADFARIDLIYVVDDPRIVNETLTLAAHYESLFRVPFRVVHYGRNLGFAGANNIGAQLARAPLLLLLNSDVIPTAPGWISVLAQRLLGLPSAVAVGPLLLFADGSVQHAGMAPLLDPALPGFIWNSHPGKGAPWRGGMEPTKQKLLTAACLMLRTDDYRSLGGLDEGYLVGDFEDSDLCLKLAHRGGTLWLVPEARLWHLERQSQAIGLVPTRRRLLTFYNGWRYRKRIDHGELPNPFAAGVISCAS
jgi:O-antigen biosynthesis protein